MTTKRETWETYAKSWAAASAQEKTEALRQACDPACIYRDPNAQVEGQPDLVRYQLGFHQQVPGGHFITHYFQEHHDRSIAKWNMYDANENLLGDGVSFGQYSPEGKLIAMTGFFEQPKN